MVSGDLTARAIVGSKGRVKRLAARYRRACDYEIGAELRDSVLIQRYLFADQRRIARVVAGASRAPEITRLILEFAVGALSYRALRRGVFAEAPLLGGRLLWERLRRLMRPCPPELVTKSASEGGACPPKLVTESVSEGGANAEAAGTA